MNSSISEAQSALEAQTALEAQAASEAQATSGGSELETLTFEEALAELEDVVTSLEEGTLDLEDTVALYQRGRRLAEHCQQLLDDVALRVQQLTSENETVPFED